MRKTKRKLRELRSSAGLLKYHMLAATLGRFRRWRAASVRGQAAAWLQALPALPARGLFADLEIHLLCGKADLDMGLWAAWSILRFLPGSTLFLHGDRSVDTADLGLWRRVIANLVFIGAEEGTRAASIRLERRPLLSRWYARHVHARKIIDMHCFGSAQNLILMDSDVLCFAEPAAVIARARNQNRSFAWNLDTHSVYAAYPDVLAEIIGRAVPPKFNSGFAVVPRLNPDDLDILEAAMQRLVSDPRAVTDVPFLEQTLYAIIAGGTPDSAPLPREYTVVVGRIPARQIVRHYVGSALIRPLFHTEGVPRLRQQLAVQI